MKINLTHTPEEHAKRQAKSDTGLMAIKSMTPNEIKEYVENNTATLAQMRQVVKKLAHIVCYLIRDHKE